MKRTLPALAVSANLSGCAAPAFPLRKTLLALTIGAISHSATAAENVAERQKAKKRWSFRPHPPAILKPAAI
ncbi:ferrichrome-iron receptor [Klebsiella michiganensis]|nr:ferrichrome-iron receptor [Klebsiella michiganensis]